MRCAAADTRDEVGGGVREGEEVVALQVGDEDDESGASGRRRTQARRRMAARGAAALTSS